MIAAFLQARFSSTRLPGKVMLPILGKPMLLRQIERIQRSKTIQKLVVLTSTAHSDNVIEDLCIDNDIECFRGELDHVLDRFYQAAQYYNPSTIVRLTGDNPLVDHIVIDTVINAHYSAQADYASNVHPPTYPDGLDVEVFTFDCLQRAWHNVVLSSDKEHVTPYMHKNPQIFSLKNICDVHDNAHLRWTVDEQDDFDFVSKVYHYLYSQNPDFLMADIIKLLNDHPELLVRSKNYVRNEGYQKSLLQEALSFKRKRHV